MNQMMMMITVVLVLCGTAIVFCVDGDDRSVNVHLSNDRERRETHGTTNDNQYSQSSYSTDNYAAPSYSKSSYQGYRAYPKEGYGYDDGHHDDGYGHDQHGGGGYGHGYKTTRRSKSKLGLLALLPLLAIPVLAALGIPALAALFGAGTALVPVTTTLGTFVANPGRKKREAVYKEVGKKDPVLAKKLMETETIANYLGNLKFKIDLQDELMYSHLACSGLLDSSNECLQRLTCEFNDSSNDDIPDIERQVSSIVLNNILTNKKVTSSIKMELKRAGQYGKVFPGQCHRFKCSSAQQYKLYKSFTS